MGKIFKDCKQCGARYQTCHCEVVSKDNLRKLVPVLSGIIEQYGSCLCEPYVTCPKCSLEIWKCDFEKLLEG